jgi:hypothetical protein
MANYDNEPCKTMLCRHERAKRLLGMIYQLFQCHMIIEYRYVAYLAKEHLIERNQFIESNPNNQNVRLSELSRYINAKIDGKKSSFSVPDILEVQVEAFTNPVAREEQDTKIKLLKDSYGNLQNQQSQIKIMCTSIPAL